MTKLQLHQLGEDFFPSGLRWPAGGGTGGGHPGRHPAAGSLARQVGPLRTGGGEGAAPAGLSRFILTQTLRGGGWGAGPLLFGAPRQSGLQASGIELGWTGSISARWTDAPGSWLDRVGSAAEMAVQASPFRRPLYPHSWGNRGGEACWDGGRGLGQRLSFWVATLPVGAELARNRALLPSSALLLPPQGPRLEAVPARISPPRPVLRLPPSLFVCLLSGSEVSPSLLSLWLSLSISTSHSPFPSLPVCLSLGLSLGLSRILFIFAFSLCLSFLPPFRPPAPHQHTPHSPVYDIPGVGRWAGLQQRGGEGGRRSLPPSC